MGIYKRYVIRNALRNTLITLAESNFIAVRTLLWSNDITLNSIFTGGVYCS